MKSNNKIDNTTMHYKNINLNNKCYRRAAIIATHNSYYFKANTIKLINELKKYIDIIIIVGDNKSIINTSKLKCLSEIIIFKKHNEYDFGSYKLGFLELYNNKLLDNIDHIFFINDSIYYTGQSLDRYINYMIKFNFCGLTINEYGYKKINNVYYYDKGVNHIQSFFFCISKKIFLENYFFKFINNIKRENSKYDIIYKYEIGLSKLIIEKGETLNSFYKNTSLLKHIHDPCEFFLYNKYISNPVFIKRKYYKYGKSDLYINVILLLNKIYSMI